MVDPICFYPLSTENTVLIIDGFCDLIDDFNPFKPDTFVHLWQHVSKVYPGWPYTKIDYSFKIIINAFKNF